MNDDRSNAITIGASLSDVSFIPWPSRMGKSDPRYSMHIRVMMESRRLSLTKAISKSSILDGNTYNVVFANVSTFEP